MRLFLKTVLKAIVITTTATGVAEWFRERQVDRWMRRNGYQKVKADKKGAMDANFKEV